MEYTIAAIPTEYQGRKYRSRLEARWAAFFDLLEWPFEYEPFDLDNWSPDFVIGSGIQDCETLVEIKPITNPDNDVFNKILGAVVQAGTREALVFGICPKLLSYGSGLIQLGWVVNSEPSANWDRAFLGWIQDHKKPLFSAQVIVFNGDYSAWRAPLIGDADKTSERVPETYPRFSMNLWAEASNTVQWLPKERS